MNFFSFFMTVTITINLVVFGHSTCKAASDSLKCNSATLETINSKREDNVKSDPTLCDLLKAEHQINFGEIDDYKSNQYYYDNLEFAEKRSEFLDMFRINEQNNNNPKELKKSEEVVSINGLEIMANKLKDLGYSINSSYYYGIKMHYGMNADSMIIIFEPVILKPMNGDLIRTKISILSNAYYRFDDKGVCKQISDCDLLKFENELQNPGCANSRIYIKHDERSGKDTHKFEHKSDDTDFEDNDVRYAFMPMQQIMRMYEDNHGDCNNGLAMIKFSFVVNKFRTRRGINLFNKYQAKVHVVASYNLTKSRSDKAKKKDDFEDLGADYTEKCPSNCEVSQ